MDNIESIPRNNIAEAVYQKMQKKILSGEWKQGEKLPSEFELSEAFEVSRTSIRSAVQKLRNLGIIYTKHGRGSFVSNEIESFRMQANDKPILHLTKGEFMDMMVFRQTVEFKCIELAAKNATDEDIALIEDALNRMLVNKNDYKKYSQADLDFHMAIINAAHNKVFSHAIKYVKSMYYFYLEELNRVLGITLDSIDAHIKIFMAIKNRDVETAKLCLDQAMECNIVMINNLDNN
ncbi:FadR/GntR family transcriptional regulator [Pectobacterium carotovorum]|uniref:FadR/GntR family transcriptional regulator n=1 Tax=Pectobacterium carotovorum TaxID=554 RepID=UPI002A821D50|nr:FadR/GntR family transcriptional regulator [Pectobacterium carotovorum]MDY4375103.1 FadR/GntR family transcriptional regulator [Pectobacterium carotovorum subsp. carotovorum]